LYDDERRNKSTSNSRIDRRLALLFAVIMAGGSGTRFWPWSREKKPKHTLNISGKESLLAETVRRISSNIPISNVFIVTTQVQSKIIRDILPDIPKENIVAEPFGRDTAPCIGLAASIINQRHSDAVMAVMPADHIITPEDKFVKTLDIAYTIAKESSSLVTLGIRPDTPSVHYGYIHRGGSKQVINGIPVYNVSEFKEKPDKDTAQEYLDTGEYYWNSGIFVWSTETILACIKQFMPDLSSGLSRIQQHLNTPDVAKVIAEEYKHFKKISIDYGIMEKAKDVRVLETDFSWDDIGTWKALERLNEQDDAGNTVAAKHAGINTDNCIIIGENDHLITTANVADLIIVQTKDATLICNKNKDEDIKKLVKKLKEQGFDRYL
ncbi:MAG: mannose-1-phosphate guanylyltransferase, partial [Candidatus Anammoxibacter sp.]